MAAHLPPGERPVGAQTRGTTNANRLRRVDRWLVALHGSRLRRAPVPLVVDLGYGRHPITTIELADRLCLVRPDVRVVGVEIDRARVLAAAGFARPGLEFARGGFNLPAGVRRPVVIRAMNVLRQYSPEAALAAWRDLCGQLDQDGVLVEGTCDEVGRRCTWVALDPSGPRTLTFAARVEDLERPGELAERLPKALIHRNVPGEAVHEFLAAWDDAWLRSRGGADGSPRTRWSEAAALLLAGGRRIARNPARWKLGELTVAWSEVG
ncbi:MAG: class I SAM-dependent methyltransferase [Actinomycetota bacterium]